SFTMTRAHGISRMMRCALPSADALSTTTTSHGTDGGNTPSDRTHSTTSSPPFQLTMTTLTVLAAAARWMLMRLRPPVLHHAPRQGDGNVARTGGSAPGCSRRLLHSCVRVDRDRRGPVPGELACEGAPAFDGRPPQPVVDDDAFERGGPRGNVARCDEL